MYFRNIYSNKMNNREIQGLANREITPIGVIQMLAAMLKKQNSHI